MKKILFLMLTLFVELSYGQINYYTFNNDSLYSKKRVRSIFETAVKNLPDQYVLKPTIYHRIIKKDSIINYVSFIAVRSGSEHENAFEFTYSQDSVFLLLNKKLPEFRLKDLNGT